MVHPGKNKGFYQSVPRSFTDYDLDYFFSVNTAFDFKYYVSIPPTLCPKKPLGAKSLAIYKEYNFSSWLIYITLNFHFEFNFGIVSSFTWSNINN